MEIEINVKVLRQIAKTMDERGAIARPDFYARFNGNSAAADYFWGVFQNFGGVRLWEYGDDRLIVTTKKKNAITEEMDKYIQKQKAAASERRLGRRSYYVAIAGVLVALLGIFYKDIIRFARWLLSLCF